MKGSEPHDERGKVDGLIESERDRLTPRNNLTPINRDESELIEDFTA